jgi:Transposase DDE domain
MSLPSLFSAFSTFLHSPQFRDLARHADAGNAFVRQRKLPLPALVAVMLSGMRKSVQTELDEFFAHLKEQAQLVHHVSEQAFAKARAKLSTTAIPALNDWLVARADAEGFVPRWRGRRLVAADASTLCFGRRASHVARAASADQIAFGLYLPGAEMMLAASLHSVHEGERQMLFQHIDRLSGGDVLLMDRGYPSRWLVAVLNARGIGFCMRVEKAGNSGFACVRDFLRSGENERIVTLAAPDRRDADDYECPATPQTVRLIRHVASTGRVRVLMTNLLDPQEFPSAEFGDLYHQRWRIEEAFKRLKHRLNLEHVSGLSQQAALHDFAAKIVCDNLQSLATETALREASLSPTRRVNCAAAHSILRPLLPALLLGADIATRLLQALQLIAGRTYSHRPGIVKSKPRVMRPKPHKSMTQKPC